MIINEKTRQLVKDSKINITLPLVFPMLQSELQTYLRDNYNAHIMIEPIMISDEIVNAKNEPIYVFSSEIYFMLFTDEDIIDSLGDIQYAKYEEALEVALQDILKAIIKHNESNEMETEI